MSNASRAGITSPPSGAPTAAQCLVPDCSDPRAHDGLCLVHLWDAEHHTRYMGGPHGEAVDECPVCADRPRGHGNTRAAYDLTRARLGHIAALGNGWCEGYGTQVRDAAIAQGSRLLDQLEQSAAAHAGYQKDTDPDGWPPLGPPSVSAEEDGALTFTWHRVGSGLLTVTIDDDELDTILTVNIEGDHGTRLMHDPWTGEVDELIEALTRFATS